MFTWICPQCGREVPPAYTECPDCAPQAANAPQPAVPAGAPAAPPEPAPPAGAAPPQYQPQYTGQYPVPGNYPPAPQYPPPPPQYPPYGQPPGPPQAPSYAPYYPPQPYPPYPPPPAYPPQPSPSDAATYYGAPPVPQAPGYPPPPPPRQDTGPFFGAPPQPPPAYNPPPPPPRQDTGSLFGAPAQQPPAYMPPPPPPRVDSGGLFNPPPPATPTPAAPAPSAPPSRAEISTLFGSGSSSTEALAERRGLPTWLLTIIFAVAFVGLVGGIYWLVGSRRGSTPSTTVENPAAKPGAATSPWQKYIEVSGVRFTENAKKDPLVKFVLTNHSGMDISGLTGNVTVWGRTQKSEEEAAGTFVFKADLAPYAAKDMEAPLTTKLKIYELPDWQNVSTDLQVTGPGDGSAAPAK